MEVIEFIDSLFFRKATWIWLNFVCVRQIIYTKYLVVSKTSFTFAPRKGEVLEWLKRHAWKACIPQKGIRGSNPRLSAINAENQQIIKQTPNFIPKNVKLGVFILFKTNHIRSENNLIKNRTNEKNNQFIFRKISYLCSK